ncbi:hypothetical protein [Lederbergia citrea]|nr:hypothetical protein [Lederbergia citrea]
MDDLLPVIITLLSIVTHLLPIIITLLPIATLLIRNGGICR